MRLRPLGAMTAAATLVALLAPAPVAADDLDRELAEVVDQIRELNEAIGDVTAERSDLAARIRAAGGRLEQLLAEISANEASVSRLEGDIAGGEARLAELRGELSDLYDGLSDTRTSIAHQRQGALQAARDAYMLGRQDLATIAFAADRLTDLSLGIVYLERVGRHRRGALAALEVLVTDAERQEESIRSREGSLQGEVVRSESLRLDLLEMQAQLDDGRATLEATIADLESLLTELDEEVAHFEEELDVLQSEQTRVKRSIAAEQRSRAPRPPRVSAVGFVRPVPGKITSGFGPRRHPILGYTRVHTGVDMRAASGEPIKAASDGKVIVAGTRGGYGRTVIIDHGGGLSTLYAHMSSLGVSKGETVSAGEVVGRVGSSGLATGAHLHFEVRIGGDPVDPVPYLRG